MKTLTIEEMELITGGVNCSEEAVEQRDWLALGFGVASLVTGGVGAIIFGPSSLGLAVANIMCH